jgi:D-amino-acid dehydrogenase
MALRVIVAGAGIVGAACAIELRKAGFEVVLADPGEPGAEQAASYGNGAWLSPSSVVPVSMPGMWKKVPGYLLDRQGPLTIRWQALPRLLPWLWRFVRAGSTVKKVQATAAALSPLLRDAPARHQALAREAGVPELIQQRGLLYVYPDRADFDAEALGWRLRRDNGVAWEEWDGAKLRERVPALADRYAFGAYVAAGAHCLDPGAYVAALAAHAVRLGATRLPTAIQGLEIAGGRLRGVRTASGIVECDRVVIAAGVHSRALAREAGDALPLESERGYHVSIAGSAVTLDFPVMPSDGRMANTSTLSGLRVAGQVELASVEAEPDWRRADILLAHARRAYPGLASAPEAQKISRWMGHRPSSADGLPYIGPASGCAAVFHAFGHGHVGLASGPATAQLIAALMAGETPPFDPRPYSAKRI